MVGASNAPAALRSTAFGRAFCFGMTQPIIAEDEAVVLEAVCGSMIAWRKFRDETFAMNA